MRNNRNPASQIEHVLYCTDFSAGADTAFMYALKMAGLCGAALTLLHLIPEPDAQFWKSYIYEVENVDSKAKADVDARIAEYAQHVPPELRFRVEHRIGRPDEEILDFAISQAVDMIVLPRPPHSTMSDVFFGSLTGKVARRAPCPILIVPEKSEKR